ncbi:MAG: SigE family RNA polymerase sigma factor [Actinomycetota bacterium]
MSTLPDTATAPIAFEEFVATRYAGLRRMAYLLTGDWGRAEDLVQTALAKTWLAWPRLERRGELDAYVRRIVVTSHASWWRRRWRGELPTENLPDTGAADDEIARSDLRAALRQALAKLPPRQRAAVVLRHYEQLSEAAVAQLLGVSIGTVKSRCSRGLAALRTAGVPGVETAGPFPPNKKGRQP